MGYGKEDLSKIDRNKILKCLKSGGFKSAERLTEIIHFDLERPEYHNIYISSLKDKHAMNYNNEKWIAVLKTDFIDKLYEDKKNYIE